MNTETRIQPGTDIVSAVEKDHSLALVDPNAFEAWLIDLRSRVDGLDNDVSRHKNREAIRSAAASIRSKKAEYDRSRLALTKGYREMTAKVNDAGKDIDAKLEALAVQVRKPLTEWEEAEKARVNECRESIERIKAAATVTMDDTAETVRARGAKIWAFEIVPDRFGDMLAEAQAAKETTVAVLKSALARLTQEEADLAELAKLRAEAEARAEADRIAAEKAEAERIEALRIEEERIAAERAETARLAAIEADKQRVEQARKDAAEQAQREAEATAKAERDRIEREHAEQLAAEKKRADDLTRAESDRLARLAAEEAEAKARAKKRDHRAKIMGEAKIVIMAVSKIDEAAAVLIVKAIVNGSIPHVSLEF